MSRKKKILIICHLCLAFSFLFWLLLQPYVKAIVAYKSQLALYEMVHEKNELFQQLSPSDQRLILEGYSVALQKTVPSFWKALGSHFLSATPPFALAWLFFSILISFLLLFQIEGASKTVWILPMLVVGYAYFQQPILKKETLFPSENYVLDHYVDSEGGNSREKLLRGWHRYLVKEWAKEGSVTESTIEKGLFFFNIARLKWILEGKGDEVIEASFASSLSFFRIFCYSVWNILFAWIVSRKEKSIAAPSALSS